MRALAALLSLLTLSAPALAQAEPPALPVLKPIVTVASDIVVIGDLFENAGAKAQVPIFRAPDLGHIGVVATARILEAVRPHQLGDVETSGIAEVAVTRLSRSFGIKEIEALVLRAAVGKHGLGAGENLSISFDREMRSMHFPPDVGDLQVIRFSYDPRSTRFDAAFDLSNAPRRTPLRFSGTIVETVEVAVLAQALNRGDVLQSADLALERRPKNTVPSDAVGAEQALGLALRRPLRAGQPLRPTDLVKPQLVAKNETVTIVYEVPGITLTVRGKALESGAAGELVNVQNLQSKRTIQGTVTGQGVVTVAAASTAAPRLAAHSPPRGTERKE
jgi:flagella basal body P-ring formation protein FlgA